jgi:two-component system NtrC family sensor kinase
MPEGDSAAILTAIADIAARLTVADPTPLVASDVLERARVVLKAAECSVWIRGVHGLHRTWGAGEETLTATDIDAAMDAALAGRRRSRSTARVVEMRFGPRTIGLLAVQLAEAPSAAELKCMETLASLLAAFIASSERSQRLEDDLQIRVREVESQRHFTEAIVDALPLGLYVIDRDYRIVVWNRKRETGMQGVSREEAIGRTIFEILHRQPAVMLRREFEEVFATGRMQQFQMESQTSGEMRTYRLSKIPMRDDTQTVTHIITIGEDITDWVEVRERVAQTEKLAAVGRLAAGIMHEINNPLATISACAESLALETTFTASGPEYLKIIESEVQRCKRIIDGLLDFSRPQPLQRQSLDINTVVERALFLLKHHGRFKQLKVDADLAQHLPPVHASSEQLIQVMIALLMNAADAMPQYGHVFIRTAAAERKPRAVTVEVHDEGTGIPRSQMARIFEPFYTTKEQGRGTGLGLAICYGIVAEHGGRIEVESEPGQGSTFRIVLPVEGE